MSQTEDGSIKKDENNVIYGPFNEIQVKDGIGTTLFNHMKENGDNIAQIDVITGEKQTYGEFLDKCIKTCIYLQAKGIEPNDIVAICSYNNLDNYVPFVGALFSGAIVACTHPQLGLLDTVYLFKQIRPKIVFVSKNAVELIEKTLENAEITSEIVVFGESQKHSEFKEINDISYEPTFRPFSVRNVRDTAIITFSSGTTGFPKGVCLSHFGLLGPIIEVEATKSIILFSSTPYWVTGVLLFIRSVLDSCTRIVIPDFDETQIWKWISTYKVEILFCAPSQLIGLTKRGCPSDIDLSCVKIVGSGGAKLSQNQILKIRSLFSNACLLFGFGLTELSGIGLMLLPFDDKSLKIYQEKPHTIGRPVSNCIYKVVDTETEETLGPNQTGELRVKTVFQMNGYYNADASNTWDSEGFVKTGDLMYYDEDLNFFYVDRIKEMLKYRSYQISPGLLENIVLSHPAVKNVVVIGKFDEEDGEHPLAVVETIKPVTEKEILDFVTPQVADTHRLRGGVKFVDKIPVSVTGKNRRLMIRNIVMNDGM